MEIESALEETVDYAKRFKSNLNKDEIGKRLISDKVFPEKAIEKAIEKIKDKKNRYFESKFAKGYEMAKEIEKYFKDILFLGISGSVASDHPKKNDDIDFLVITKKNKLWKTRLFLRWWIFIRKIPHRKYGKRSKKDEFCFNLWLDESSLLMTKNRRILKNAVDLVLLKPLINKKQTYEKFILANDWARKWVATPYCRLSACQPISFSDKTKNKKNDKLVNCLYFWPQYWYMKRKIRGEEIGLHKAFFHEPMVK